ncbi:MAG: hypothetical protein OEY36_09410 [Gammaproteobacteria bacterium]|nr:hypothetical protein [Gammaproteobacteria bacterium]
MNNKLMVLPSRDYNAVRLVKVPDDYEEHELFRHVTGIISSVEEEKPDYEWDDVALALEDHGFEVIDFVLGPALD